MPQNSHIQFLVTHKQLMVYKILSRTTYDARTDNVSSRLFLNTKFNKIIEKKLIRYLLAPSDMPPFETADCL